MFTHLDDPTPYTPPPGLRAAVHGTVRRRRHRRVAVVGGVASVAALGVGAVAGVRDRVAPEQIEVGGLAEQPTGESRDPSDPMTVLLVGIDSHGDPTIDEAEGRSGTLTDTIVVARVDPEAGQLRLFVVPRDLEVPAQPGVRINSLLASGGPQLLVETIHAQLGIELDHYVQVDFAGFRRGVDTLGGIRVSVPARVRAERSGLDLAAGCQVIDGEQALALARARSDVSVLSPAGGWVVDPSGDFGRQDRAGVLAAALLRAVADVGPADLPRLVLDGVRDVTVDHALDTDDLVDLARQAGAAEVVSMRLPVTESPPDEPAILRLADGADAVVARLLGEEPPAGPGAPGGAPVEPPPGDTTGLAPC